MGRIMAIDYGRKRVGIAVTDELKLIANALTTVPANEIFDFLKDYTGKEKLDCIVVGEPKDLKNQASEAAAFVEPFVKKLRKLFPEVRVERFDERFTSKMATQTMIDAGLKKKKRQQKDLVDSISATLILQSYLDANPSI